MHGRKKKDEINKSDEQRLKEKAMIEKGSKLLYSILQLRTSNILDDNSLALTTKVVEVNPEFPTAWNLRRNVLSKKLLNNEIQIVTNILIEDLNFVCKSLEKFPKAYCLWAHRVWVLETLASIANSDEESFANMGKELDLCSLFLQYDDRNFHCWNYRHWIMSKWAIHLQGADPNMHFVFPLRDSIKCLKDLDVLDIEFTWNRIEKNFSNYSAWHVRGTHCAALLNISKELEELQQAVYVEPSDQSIWQQIEYITLRSGAVQPRLIPVSFSNNILSFQEKIAMGENLKSNNVVVNIKIVSESGAERNIQWISKNGTEVSDKWEAVGDEHMISDVMHVTILIKNTDYFRTFDHKELCINSMSNYHNAKDIQHDVIMRNMNNSWVIDSSTGGLPFFGFGVTEDLIERHKHVMEELETFEEENKSSLATAKATWLQILLRCYEAAKLVSPDMENIISRVACNGDTQQDIKKAVLELANELLLIDPLRKGLWGFIISNVSN